MQIQVQSGAAVAPLQRVTILGATGGTLVVRDGAGRVYLRQPAQPLIEWTVGGAPGQHQVTLEDEAGQVVQRAAFRVAATTALEDAGGSWAELLQMLHYTMIRDHEQGVIRSGDRLYHFFVAWLRDHVHVLKGMKYFATQLKDGIDLYSSSQRADGMIWDNVYPRSGPNYWDVRFADGDFIQHFADGSAEWKRIPVEADVEYLFVEGLYRTWQATGDDGWMADTLPAAMRALDYCVNDRYRWSERYQLLKRGYTIDTWDFQNEFDAVVAGDAMRVDPDRTRFGVMFGDNTGYAQSCAWLAEMLDHVGRHDEARRYRERGAAIRERLDALSWNGRFFTHHVREDAAPDIDLGVDEAAQVSLSNAYSLNRGLRHDQCAAIIRTYQAIQAELPPGSPGEWYTIYPPFGRGYGDHNDRWQYMNGGVTPIVAGELAHGALEHGFEAYGVDILRRLQALGRQHGGVFHCTYTGAMPEPPAPAFTPLDLAAFANIDVCGAGAPGVPGWTGEGENDLHALPGGAQRWAGVPFLLPDPATNGRRVALGLRQRAGYASSLSVPVAQQAASIYLLHCVSQTGAGGVGGTLTLHYADGSAWSEYIVRDVNVSGWWFPEAPASHGPRRVEVAWRGSNAMCPDVGLVAYGLDNPHPERTIERIELRAAEDGAFWAVLAITLSPQPAFFPPSPISYGIPDNWGAAAVVYALVEGLAGVVDRGVMFERALVAPRWTAASTDEVAVTIAYPESAGYVAYRYRHDLARRTIALELTGSGNACDCHVLLPPEATGVETVAVDGAAVSFQTALLETSRYADFGLELPGPRRVIITYTT